MADDLSVKVAEIDQRTRSHAHRIDKLEQSNEAISRIATSVEVMAIKQDQIAVTVDRLDGKVTILEAKPGKRWEAVAEKIILLVVAGAVGFLLAQVGIT